MRAVTKCHIGQWGALPYHAGTSELAPERYLEIREEAARTTQGNVPMAGAACVTVLFPLALVAFGALAIYLINR